MSFADRAIRQIRRLGHPLCVGLDPHLDLIPEVFRRGSMQPNDPATVAAVEDMLLKVLERVGGLVPVVKPQIAFFERLGSRGLAALERICERSRQLGLLVLLDAKRGDIGSTAEAYAKAYFGYDAPLPVDALTVNPYLGLDSLEPFVKAAKTADGGLFVLVKTSNPGAADFQGLEASGEPLFAKVAGALAAEAEAWRGEEGWSSLGVVVGATQATDAPRIREKLPHSLFLVPGYGAQGAGAREALAGFVPGPKGRREGGLVNSSRGLVFAPALAGAPTAAAWEKTFDQLLDQAIGELGEAL
jgi:orotidine-5'-phosphate decarboxylase